MLSSLSSENWLHWSQAARTSAQLSGYRWKQR